MTQLQLDVEALVTALDAQRQSKKISWRELARETGVSASTLTRMQQGKRPDADTLTALIQWLGLPLEHFTKGPGTQSKITKPDPVAIASVLLRGKKKMSSEAQKALMDIVRAALRLVEESK